MMDVGYDFWAAGHGWRDVNGKGRVRKAAGHFLARPGLNIGMLRQELNPMDYGKPND